MHFVEFQSSLPFIDADDDSDDNDNDGDNDDGKYSLPDMCVAFPWSEQFAVIQPFNSTRHKVM